jgi:hypothetical protein
LDASTLYPGPFQGVLNIDDDVDQLPNYQFNGDDLDTDNGGFVELLGIAPLL